MFVKVYPCRLHRQYSDSEHIILSADQSKITNYFFQYLYKCLVNIKQNKKI